MNIGMFLWCPQKESNLHHLLRTEPLYPLSYKGFLSVMGTHKKAIFELSPPRLAHRTLRVRLAAVLGLRPNLILFMGSSLAIFRIFDRWIFW